MEALSFEYDKLINKKLLLLFLFLEWCVGKTQITKIRLNLPVAVFLVVAFVQTIRGVFISHLIKWLLIVVVLSVGIQRLFLRGNGLERFGARFLSSFSTKLSSSTFSNVTRLLEYGLAFEKIKSKPIFGHGVGYKLSYVDPILRERIRSGIVHQFYIMIILKMGLIGPFAFLWVYYVFFREGLRGSRKIEDSYYKGLAYGFMANSIEELVISFTNHQFATVDNNFYLAFTMAGVMVLISRGTRGQTWTYQSS